jgi:WhiB family redox-sensing transcriptional regulator
MRTKDLPNDTPAWMHQAACKDEPLETFFPEHYRDDLPERALAICATCPVIDDCKAYARKLHLIQGIYGAMTPAQRASAHKNHVWRIDREHVIALSKWLPLLRSIAIEQGIENFDYITLDDIAEQLDEILTKK